MHFRGKDQQILSDMFDVRQSPKSAEKL
jgi:hypothetical protein